MDGLTIRVTLASTTITAYMKENYKELKAWQLGIDIVNDVHSIIKNHVNKEKLAEFNIIYQLGKTLTRFLDLLAKQKEKFLNY